MIKRAAKVLAIAFISLVLVSSLGQTARAEETAAFHVQTAEVQTDGTIAVSVYLTDTVTMGGLDAEMVYDPSEISYVSSEFGETFKDGYGDIHCDEETGTIKCVLVYPEAKTAHGELMRTVFRLNGRESYQPEFRVTNLLDATTELQPIPYTVEYQQADGTWTDTRDESGVRADPSVIRAARQQYGSEQDIAASETEGQAKIEDGEVSSNPGNEEVPDSVVNGAEDSDETQISVGSVLERAGKTAQGKYDRLILIGLCVVAAILVIIFVILVIRRRRKKRRRRKE